MLTSAYVWLGIALSQSESPAPSPSGGSDAGGGGGSEWDIVREIIAPILGTGLVGSLFLMVLFRIKIMPTYVFDNAQKAWDEERARMETAHAAQLASKQAELDRVVGENGELKQGLKDANAVYTQQVIPTLTRVLDAERELVDLRRDEAAERRRRGAGPD